MTSEEILHHQKGRKFSGQQRKGALSVGRLLSKGRLWQPNTGVTLPLMCQV